MLQHDFCAKTTLIKNQGLMWGKQCTLFYQVLPKSNSVRDKIHRTCDILKKNTYLLKVNYFYTKSPDTVGKVWTKQRIYLSSTSAAGHSREEKGEIGLVHHFVE